MKTLPAVFSRRHHDVLELSVRAAQSTVNVSRSALHRCQQPGPAHACRFHAGLLLSSQNQVAELLGLRHIVLDMKELVKAGDAEVLTDTAAKGGVLRQAEAEDGKAAGSCRV